MKNANKLLVFFMLAASMMFYSCESTTSTTPPTTKITGTTLFMLSEGGFGKNNASLDAYSIKNGDSTLSNNIIQPLGDVGNDIQIFGKKMYIVLENSNKLLVVNPDSIADRTSIEFQLHITPYKMAQASPSEIWVTEFTNNQIAVINPNSNTLSSSINIDTTQTDITVFNGKAFVCTNANKLEVIDVASKQVLSNKYIGDSPAQVISDSIHNSIIVLTYGTYGKSFGKILWVDPSSYAITDSLNIDSTDFLTMLVPAGNKAFTTFGTKVCTLDYSTHKLLPFLIKGYYKGYFDPTSNQLILGDAKDYTSAGTVDIYDATSGAIIKTLNSGIIPGHFVIYRKQ